MQALILAAGMGKRLKELTQDNTKCMVEVNGMKIIDRVLAQLFCLDLSKIVIVVGYKGDKLKKHIETTYTGGNIEYVFNPIYDRTNNIYSLYLAKDYLLNDDTILLESDLIFEDRVLEKLIQNENQNIALVDKYESWMDGTVVTIDDDCHIKDFISKKYFDFSAINSYYKTVNIYKFSKDFSATHYVPFLEAYSKALGNNEYYEQVLRVLTLTDNSSIIALPLDGEKWYEIDDIQDLDIAESIFSKSDEEQYDLYSKRYGGYWRYPKMLDFCYLVNPFFPSDKMVDEMKASFNTLIREYPSGMRVNSLLTAKYFGVKCEHIVVGNGAAEIIKSYMENFVDKIGVVFPTFEEYPNRMDKDKVVKYVPNNDCFSYSAGDLMSFFSNKGIDTLLLINPDNPSGNYICYKDLISLIEWTKKEGVNLIVDESFVDFADETEKVTLLDDAVLSQNKHLRVIKSISKSYGVPGLRLGVMVSGNTELIAKMKKILPIWNINSFAEFYLQIFEKYKQDYVDACYSFIKVREAFKKELDTIPYLRVIPSSANYFLCEVLGKMHSRDLSVSLLCRENILVKDCSSKSMFDGKQYIRIAIRDNNDNNRLIAALKKYSI